MKKFVIPLLISAGLATTALSHSGVKNAKVLARMDGMKAIASELKVLGAMSKGATAFDVQLVEDTARKLRRHSDEILTLFEAQEADPKSEARPNIWTDWADFSAKTDDMTAAALTLSQIKTEAAFKSEFLALGKTCAACHEIYRIDKN